MAMRAPAKPASNLLREQVTHVWHWTDKLFTIRTTRDPAFRFESGQFAMIGIEVDGRPLLRAYSMASATYDEHLEFFSIIVPDGPLTSKLRHIEVGDTLLVSRKPTGTLLLGNLRPGKRLYMLSTGTGLAPFASIIQDPTAYEQYEHVVLVHGCRNTAELEYGTRVVDGVRDNELLSDLAHDKLLHYTTVTREPYYHRGRINDLIANGRLFADLGLPPLDRAQDRVMICGNPEMLQSLRTMLEASGFTEGSNSAPGDFVIERAFVER
jgi:ferredoxin--NADP+ reductase